MRFRDEVRIEDIENVDNSTSIDFCIKNVWVMRITEEGKIEFNRKDWP